MSDLYASSYDGVAYTINEKRSDTYSEASSGQTIHTEYQLQTDTGIGIVAARDIAQSFVLTSNLRRREGLYLSRFDIEHAEEEDLDKLWTITLEWSTSASSGTTQGEHPREPYTEQETWTTEGGTAHITEAVGSATNPYGETVTQVDSNDPGPSSFLGRIGFNGETAEGVDVIRPTYSFTLKKEVLDTDLNSVVPGSVAEFGSALTYRQVLVLLTGSVNNDTFRGWSAGNVLFEGVSSTTKVTYDESSPIPDGGGGYVIPYVLYHEITYKFRCNLGRTNMPVAGAQVNKEGWQYLWVYTRKQDDSSTGVTLEYPLTVVVNDVYERRPFSLLGFA